MERTIRNMAKEAAGAQYELIRKDAPSRRRIKEEKGIDPDLFFNTFPTVNDYISGRYHLPDGRIMWGTPGWMHYIEEARNALAKMLHHDSGVHPNLKEGIHKALIEDAEKQYQADSHGWEGQPNIYQKPLETDS